MNTETKRPRLKLIGEDGNAFFIIGRARSVAKKMGWSAERIEEMTKKATSSDYDNLLRVMMEYFDVV